MANILVNTEELNSVISYFALAQKELEETEYRVKQVSNEMAEDVNLQLCPEYEMLKELYYTFFKKTLVLNEMMKDMLKILVKTPELYEKVERENIDKIERLILKADMYKTQMLSGDTSFHEAIEQATDKADVENLIKQSLISMDVSTQAATLNEIPDDED